MNDVTRSKQGNKTVLYWYTDAAAGNTGSKDSKKRHDVSIMGLKRKLNVTL